jgi:gliding motility-associated lipoprotein GldH
MQHETNNRIKGIVRQMLLAGGLLLALSCKNKAFYEQYQVVELEWGREKEYFFTYNITDNRRLYRVSIEVRNNRLYPYQNLWLFCSEEQPVGPVLCDTVECMLADDYGKWFGRGISIFHLAIPFRTRYRFPHKGQYTFCIRQGMRNTRLNGIEEIGLRIEPDTD